MDWYLVGARKNGIYAINGSGLIHHVYCDFSSEPNFVWTLVTSFSLENNDLFKNKPLYDNYPISEYEPNWNSYRWISNFINSFSISLGLFFPHRLPLFFCFRKRAKDFCHFVMLFDSQNWQLVYQILTAKYFARKFFCFAEKLHSKIKG